MCISALLAHDYKSCISNIEQGPEQAWQVEVTLPFIIVKHDS